VSLQLADGGGGDGQAEAGDTLTITFSQPMLPESFCRNWSSSLEDLGNEYFLPGLVAHLSDGPSLGAPDSLTISAPSDLCDDEAASVWHLGTINLGGDYFAGAGGIDFTDSTAQLDSDWKVLTITLGDPDPEQSSNLLTGVGAGQPSFAPDPVSA